MSVGKKKSRLLICEHTLGLYFYHIETKGGSALYFSQDKHKLAYIFKRIKGGRDENVSTLPYNEL